MLACVMDRFFAGPLSDRARNTMRRAGYAEQKAEGNEIAFVRRLQGTPFPRLHAYVEERDGGARVSLHVDQKQPSYGGSRMHGGEYGGPLVEREMARIATYFVPQALKASGGQGPQEDEPKGGFFSRLFGG